MSKKETRIANSDISSVFQYTTYKDRSSDEKTGYSKFGTLFVLLATLQKADPLKISKSTYHTVSEAI